MPAQKSAVCVAVLQFACGDDEAANLETAASLTREAVARGAQIVLPPELFSSPYFCKTQRADFLALATPLDESPAVARFRDLARELGVVIPVSFFERAGNARFNSLAMIDVDGAVLGVYRKSHIPDGPRLFGKVLFFARRFGLSRLADALRQNRRGDLLGSMVSGGGAGDGFARGGDFAVSDRDRRRAACAAS